MRAQKLNQFSFAVLIGCEMPKRVLCVSGPFAAEAVARAVAHAKDVYVCDAGQWLTSLTDAVNQGQFSASTTVAHAVVECTIASMISLVSEPVLVVVNFPPGGTVPHTMVKTVRYFWAACPADGLPGQGGVPDCYDLLLCTADKGPTDLAIAQLAAHVTHAVNLSILEAQQTLTPPSLQCTTRTASDASLPNLLDEDCLSGADFPPSPQ